MREIWYYEEGRKDCLQVFAKSYFGVAVYSGDNLTASSDLNYVRSGRRYK